MGLYFRIIVCEIGFIDSIVIALLLRIVNYAICLLIGLNFGINSLLDPIHTVEYLQRIVSGFIIDL